jgi:Flp pilus assembly pilin Flp
VERQQRRGERGAGVTEYALLISLLILVCLAGVRWFGDETGTFLRESSDRVADAGW